MLARLTEMTIDLPPELEGDARVVGAAERGILNCDACLGPCKGFGGIPSQMLAPARAVANPDLPKENGASDQPGEGAMRLFGQ